MEDDKDNIDRASAIAFYLKQNGHSMEYVTEFVQFIMKQDLSLLEDEDSDEEEK